jgi:tetratricopeptide (TPR) repeat protein
MSSNHSSPPSCAIAVNHRSDSTAIRSALASREGHLQDNPMRGRFTSPIRNAALASALWIGLAHGAVAAGPDLVPASPIDPAPCLAAIAAYDDDRIMAACGALADDESTSKADRLKALIARAGAFGRKDQIDRAIADYDTALRLDPALADGFNARGELWRKKGDRRRALQDFAAAIRLNPDHPAAKANYKSLALELERIGAQMAVNNRPSFNCATATRAVEKAICANPDLANLDREIDVASSKVVRQATADSPAAGRALQREQDDFITSRNAGFGRPDYDLQKVMRARLDHLLAAERH